MSMMECLIKRDGPTSVQVGGFKYTFEKNKHGHSVCDVVNEGARSYFLSLTTLYRDYNPEVDYREEEKATENKAPAAGKKADGGKTHQDRDAEIFKLSLGGADATEIAQKFKISRTRVLEIVKEQADAGTKTG
jgi:DNA invertase Pin-like site-specific DNA recombinase